MTLWVGVDGGGTKTEVMVIEEGKQKAISVLGSASNPQTVGLHEACSVVLDLIWKGLQALEASIDDVACISIGMAGVDSSEQEQILHAELEKNLPKTNFEIVNDSLAALAAGTMGGSGVVLIAGTGSIAMGEDERGHVARAGGYGNLIGDEGSGFDIGRLGLMAAIQAFEGRGPETRIWNSAIEYFKVFHAQDLITKVYDSPHPVGVIASFAGEVLELWNKDEEANRIVQHAVESYERLIDSVYGQLKNQVDDHDEWTKSDVILAGGLFFHHNFLIEELASQQPSRNFHVLRQKPASGALLRAMKRIHGRLLERDVAIWRTAMDSIGPVHIEKE